MEPDYFRLRQFCCFLAILVTLTIAPFSAATQRTGDESAMLHSEVVFMYATDSEVYETYRATFTAWGGGGSEEAVKRHYEVGVRCAGSMWCLTAGAQRLHENPELHEAVVRDIEPRLIATSIPYNSIPDHTRMAVPVLYFMLNENKHATKT